MSLSRFYKLPVSVSLAVTAVACASPGMKKGDELHKSEVQSELKAKSLHSPATKALSMADGFVAQAEVLFQQGRLLQPEIDNAYIRFRAALQLEPQHKQARSGMQAILLAELAKARDALATGRLQSAARKLSELDALFPNASMLNEFRSELEIARKQRAVASAPLEKGAVKANTKAEPSRIYLDKQDLRQRNDQIKQLLGAIALQVEHSKEGVMIFARNDAEGRWIYQQMRDAVPNYRIRGDIRLGAEPAIRLLEPYE